GDRLPPRRELRAKARGDARGLCPDPRVLRRDEQRERRGLPPPRPQAPHLRNRAVRAPFRRNAHHGVGPRGAHPPSRRGSRPRGPRPHPHAPRLAIAPRTRDRDGPADPRRSRPGRGVREAVGRGAGGVPPRPRVLRRDRGRGARVRPEAPGFEAPHHGRQGVRASFRPRHEAFHGEDHPRPMGRRAPPGPGVRRPPDGRRLAPEDPARALDGRRPATEPRARSPGKPGPQADALRHRRAPADERPKTRGGAM
ncbi:MAG: hypothetical protein AVDCRST_MAG05-4283, partial [uncultured Rubrobacteraceae bacterium]